MTAIRGVITTQDGTEIPFNSREELKMHVAVQAAERVAVPLEVCRPGDTIVLSYTIQMSITLESEDDN